MTPSAQYQELLKQKLQLLGKAEKIMLEIQDIENDLSSLVTQIEAETEAVGCDVEFPVETYGGEFIDDVPEGFDELPPVDVYMDLASEEETYGEFEDLAAA